MSSSKLAFTPISDIPGIVASARAAFAAGVARPLPWRRAQLLALSRMLLENEAAILAALHADLRKPMFEGAIHEVELVAREARHAASCLSAWSAPEPVQTPSMFLPASSYVVKDPLGVVCIITPWNFPISARRRPPAPPARGAPAQPAPSLTHAPPPRFAAAQTCPSTASSRRSPRATRWC